MDRNQIWRAVRLAGTGLSVALLIWLLSRQDWNALVNGLRSVPISIVLLALALLVARHFTFALRWSFLLRAQGIQLDYWSVVKLQYASLFASNFLPTTVGGDVARLAGVMSRAQNKVAGAASVVVDRAMGAFGMLFVLPFSWPLVAGYLGMGQAVGMLASAALVDTVRDWWGRLWSALQLWLRKPRSLLMALLATWLGILFYLLAIWNLAAALDMPVGFSDVAGATGLTYFISLIPFSINAYGLREISVVFFYTQLGSTPEQSAALALVTRLALIAVSLPGSITLGGVFQSGESQDAHEQI